MEEVDKGCPMITDRNPHRGRHSPTHTHPHHWSGWVWVGECFFRVPAYPCSPGPKAVKRLCMCVCVCVCVLLLLCMLMNSRCDCDGQTPVRFIHALFTLRYTRVRSVNERLLSIDVVVTVLVSLLYTWSLSARVAICYRWCNLPDRDYL